MDVLRRLSGAGAKNQVARLTWLAAAALGAALALAACDRGPDKAAVSSTTAAPADIPAPEIDVSSPDRALKSYWAVKDHLRTVMHRDDKKDHDRWLDRRAVLGRVTTATFKKAEEQPSRDGADTFQRDVIEVKVESDTRAVILTNIRNTTPIPPGAEASRSQLQERETGNRYRYVMDKDKDGWKVAEIWDWDDYITKGWRKRQPDDGKPLFPSWTFHGI
jgi:hypothetical protein